MERVTVGVLEISPFRRVNVNSTANRVREYTSLLDKKNIHCIRVDNMHGRGSVPPKAPFSLFSPNCHANTGANPHGFLSSACVYLASITASTVCEARKPYSAQLLQSFGKIEVSTDRCLQENRECPRYFDMSRFGRLTAGSFMN